MRCFKLLGERIMSRDFDRPFAALQIRAAILVVAPSLCSPPVEFGRGTRPSLERRTARPEVAEPWTWNTLLAGSSPTATISNMTALGCRSSQTILGTPRPSGGGHIINVFGRSPSPTISIPASLTAGSPIVNVAPASGSLPTQMYPPL